MKVYAATRVTKLCHLKDDIKDRVIYLRAVVYQAYPAIRRTVTQANLLLC
jgi:hypothetical protein